ncbi:hypothetical protein NS365_13365 [Aureimonas ureilytica]|uniref:Lipoprotein n=1 Tax=Aureimonas ureilytica TaxID=401562 RepID=A0A175RNI5_9HYPH|nr:hypothetical protein [Aureimonas ureilytica]KTR05011.1 hypothetical protein NS365_13365 [Aureimonas ureilytica]
MLKNVAYIFIATLSACAMIDLASTALTAPTAEDRISALEKQVNDLRRCLHPAASYCSPDP